MIKIGDPIPDATLSESTEFGEACPVSPKKVSVAEATNGSPTTASSASRSIVPRLDRTIASGSAGQGVSTIPATRSPAARAAS